MLYQLSSSIINNYLRILFNVKLPSQRCDLHPNIVRSFYSEAARAPRAGTVVWVHRAESRKGCAATAHAHRSARTCALCHWNGSGAAAPSVESRAFRPLELERKQRTRMPIADACASECVPKSDPQRRTSRRSRRCSCARIVSHRVPVVRRMRDPLRRRRRVPRRRRAMGLRRSAGRELEPRLRRAARFPSCRGSAPRASAAHASRRSGTSAMSSTSPPHPDTSERSEFANRG